ncbi:MAG: GNAT family N-acetyltransferase [Sulfurovum sp.]|nr:GNAT family N-acetyltransferase [Sulfurovum sp.]
MEILEASESDFDHIYPIFAEIVSKGDTYPYCKDTTKDEAYRIWMETPHKTFVAKANKQIIGTYYIKPNQSDRGSHVCNCGYMVASDARGRGVATSMCIHSQETALKLGYRAMQFNLVVSSNQRAIELWNSLGFDAIGRLPSAFDHPLLGYIDALVMYKWLSPKQSPAPLLNP